MSPIVTWSLMVICHRSYENAFIFVRETVLLYILQENSPFTLSGSHSTAKHDKMQHIVSLRDYNCLRCASTSFLRVIRPLVEPKSNPYRETNRESQKSYSLLDNITLKQVYTVLTSN